MLAYTKTKAMPTLMARSFYTLAFVGALAAATALAAGSNFRVSSVQPRANDHSLRLTGNAELGLTPKVEEALGNGIPLEFVIDVRLYRERALWWDETIESWRLRRQLYYHALSGQYLIGAESGSMRAREGYGSLTEALRQLGSLDDVVLPLNAALAADSDYRVGVRVLLDIEALPPLLRPMAYTSRAWDLNSGWTTWKIQR